MSYLDRGGGASGSHNRALGTGTTIARRAPGTASTASTASLSHATSLKSTAPPSDNPFAVVTYRHLLSAGSLTSANPLRVIAHCDVDAAYAQFEASRLGIDSFAVPLAVQQWQGLIAISYKAREFGINRHCDIQKAKELCPELVKVHVQTIAPGQKEAAYNDDPRPETHKVSLDPYRRESRKILASFKATCPLGQVEKASIDESFFDLTLEVRKLLLTRYPHLKQAPKTGKGMDEPLPSPPMIEWDGCGELMPIKQLDEEGNPVDRDDEGFVPSQEHQLLRPTWTDVALAHGAKLMAKVRQNVFDQLGYTTSAGIASNKTLAKLCSGYRKPNQQTTLLPRAVPAFLRDLPVSKIRFLGGKLGREMGDMWEAKTVGDLWNVPLESMQAHFGPEAAWVHAVLRGVDHAPVSARIANKTMLASKNLRPVIRKRHEALGWLDTLSTELVTRLKELWEDERGAIDESNVQSAFEEELKKETASTSTSPYKASKAPALPTLWPKFLVLRFIRVRDGARSRQAPFPYVGTLTSEEVYKLAVRLWNEACDEMRIGPTASLTGNADQLIGGGVEIVTIALGFSGLERAETGQKSIEGFFKTGAGSNGKRKREEGAEEPSGSHQELEDEKGHEELDQSNRRKWTCNECGQTLSVAVESPELATTFPQQDSDEFFDNDDPFSSSEQQYDSSAPLQDNDAEQEAQRRLDMQIQDHRDWHFAVKLSTTQGWQDDNHTSSTQISSEAVKKPVKKAKKGSLQSFFAKQGPST